MENTFGLKNPANFAWLKAIAGDKSDNIPGIPKVGPKTFTKLFSEILDSEHIWS